MSQFIIASLLWSVLIWVFLEFIFLGVSFITGEWSTWQDIQRHLDLHKLCIPLGAFVHLWLRD